MRRVLWPVAAMVAGVLIAATALGLLVANYSTIRAQSQAMNPTIQDEDRLVVRKVDGSSVRRGDVILFNADAWGPDSVGSQVVSRVAGVAGDTVACCDSQNRLVVNGKGINENYRRNPDEATQTANYKFHVLVPDKQVFVLGDWRGNSADSRFNGSAIGKGGIPTSDITGVVISAGGTDLVATTAFTDAGLPGAAYSEDGLGTILFVAIGVGGILLIGGIVWLVVALRKRAP